MRIAVPGGGSGGPAFARVLARAGHDTLLVCRDPEQARAIATHHRNPRYLFDIELPPELRAAALADADLSGEELIAVAVPSRGFAGTMDDVAGRLGPAPVLMSLTKGLDPTTHRRMSEILGAFAPPERVAVLSGPNHPEEVARDHPTASVPASPRIELA